MRGGAVINAFEEIQSEVTEELVEAYAAELAKEITASRTRSFSDSWSATGQKSWVNLGEVTAFTIRQAK